MKIKNVASSMLKRPDMFITSDLAIGFLAMWLGFFLFGQE
jgi:hypothetical protein